MTPTVASDSLKRKNYDSDHVKDFEEKRLKSTEPLNGSALQDREHKSIKTPNNELEENSGVDTAADSKLETKLDTTRDGRILERIDEYLMDINTYQLASKGSGSGLHNRALIDDATKTTDTGKKGMEEDKQRDGDKTEDGEAIKKQQARSKLSVDEIDENVKRFRVYEEACERVKDFYAEQHSKQTVEFNIQARVSFMSKKKLEMSVWDALEKLNALIDESDPDTELSQIEHALQTAEAIRKDGRPRWMQLVGLIHDLGKLLYFFGSEGQWDVVGDTFPVGCAFDKKIIFYDEFRNNPDYEHPVYSTDLGIYSEGCGLDSVMLSWGHDEYMYHVAKLQSTLPVEALSMIRYHSFYAWHREGAYKHLMNDHDHDMLKCVQSFNPYDLYSKAEESVDVDKVKSYYQELISEFFPKVVQF